MHFLTLILTLSTLPIHTTVFNNSQVSFSIQTPLSSTIVSHNGTDYVRFHGITLSDSVGYPELPLITCFVAIPDMVIPELEWSVAGETEYSGNPVYPAPEHVISYERTPRVIEEFSRDSVACSSTEWWPEERVRVIGETRIFDQRLFQVQIFPVLFRASTNTQSTVSSVSVTVSFDSTQADWSTIGLGPFQDMVESSPIVGYKPVEQIGTSSSDYFKNFDILTGSPRMPDYVILAASGLYQQCDDAIDDLAFHRVALNGFDVALVTTDQVLTAFGNGSNILTPDMIRDFTEHIVMLKNTDCPSAGVFCGALSSYISCYDRYGRGILEAVYARGQGRLGNSIAFARIQNLGFFSTSSGGFSDAMGQFNLLGDPALDITDQVRYPDRCDLVVHTSGFDISPYPREIEGGFQEAMSFTVRNSGGAPSGAFDLRIRISDDYNSTLADIPCASLPAGDEMTYDYSWSDSWFSPPSTIAVTAHADPSGQCDDSWIHNNSASVEITLNDIYPMEENWPVETEGVVGTTPLLVNINSDPGMEVVAISGSRLTAWNHLGRRIWSNGSYPVSSFFPPLAADFDHDGEMEIAVTGYSCSEVYLFDGDGTLLCDQTLPGVRRIAAGDMCSEQGIELVAASGSTIYLYEWTAGQFNLLDSKIFTYDEVPNPLSLSCTDLSGDSYAEAVFSSGWQDNEVANPDPTFYSVAVYDWENQQALSNRTWFLPAGTGGYPAVCPAAGMLAGNPVAGLPQEGYDTSSPTGDPARILPAGGGTEIQCERSFLSANTIKYAMFADWDPLVSGADVFVLPSETQCFAWDRMGSALENWPAFFSEYTLGSPVCPPALGDLDNDGVADVLTATAVDEYWRVLAYASSNAPLSGFPIIMPPCADDLGGFAVADIDLDGKVEVVFGSDDELLQCWELGSCTAGYSPWPQYQHDSGRAGVLD